MDYLKDYIQLPDISPARWGFIGGVFVYTVALYLSYVHLISPVFGYLGLVYRPEGILPLVVVECLALLPSLWMPVRMRRPSQIIYLLLYLWWVIPFFLGSAFTGILPLHRIILFGLLFCGVLAAIRLIYLAPLMHIPKVVKTQGGFWLAFISIAGLTYGYLGWQYDFSVEIPSLRKVYLQRGEFRQTVTGIGAYIFNWVAKAINPFLIARGYVNWNPLLFGVGVGGQLLLFAMSGLKAVLFSGLLLAAAIIALQGRGKNFGNWIVWGLVILVGLTAYIDNHLEMNLATSLFVRRLLFVPGLNASYYFDFFSSNHHTLFGHSIFNFFIDYPYDIRPAKLIGDVYVNSASGIDISANANFWADAYASFGILGILFFSAGLAGVLWLADSLAKGCQLKLAVLMLAYPAYILTNTKLQTTLLTHGLGLVLLILYLLPRHESPSDRE